MMENYKKLIAKIATLKIWGNHLVLGFIICSVLFELNKLTYGKTDWYVNCIIWISILLTLHLVLVIYYLIKKPKENPSTGNQDKEKSI